MSLFGFLKKKKKEDKKEDSSQISERSSEQETSGKGVASQDSGHSVPKPDAKIRQQIKTVARVEEELSKEIADPEPLPQRLSRHLPPDVPAEFRYGTYEVELIRAPDEDPEEEITSALKNALTLIRNGSYEPAWMIFEVIDKEFRKRYAGFLKGKKTKLIDLYDEVTFYLWVGRAYELAAKRDLKNLRLIAEVVHRLGEKVSSVHLDDASFREARKKLAFIDRVLSSRKLI